jgi:hypothetical protein
MHCNNEALFDHPVGAGEERGRHDNAERLSRVEIDDKLQLRRLLNRQIGRLGSLEYLINVCRDPTKLDRDARSRMT